MVAGDHTLTNTAGKIDVDHDHAVLVNLMESVRDALADASSDEEVVARLDQVLEFTRVHFDSEHMLMRLYGFPQYSSHFAEHEETLRQLEKLRKDLLTMDLDDSLALLDTLVAGTIVHIQTTDRELRLYLRNSTNVDA